MPADSAAASSSSSSAASSPMGTSVTSEASSSSLHAKPSAPLVIRNGHIIPQIRLTPPDSRPEKSIPVPEQDLGNDHLFVPLRTEEIGWEEGGLIWAAKRFCYPTVNLYGGEDDRVIGTYRGGPEGYRFINITDSAFSLAGQSEDSSQAAKPTKKTSSGGSKSSMPRGPVTKAVQSTPVEAKSEPLQRSYSSLSVSSSSAASSRQGSFSTDEGDSSGGDTGATTPVRTDSPAQDEDDMVKCLGNALTKVREEQQDCDVEMCEASTRQGSTQKLAKRTGSAMIPSEPIDASRLCGPLKAQQLPEDLLGKTVRLSDDVPARHFQTYQGRAQAEPAIVLPPPASPAASSNSPTPVTASPIDDYAAGWAYEHNMRAQHANDASPLAQ